MSLLCLCKAVFVWCRFCILAPSVFCIAEPNSIFHPTGQLKVLFSSVYFLLPAFPSTVAAPCSSLPSSLLKKKRKKRFWGTCVEEFCCMTSHNFCCCASTGSSRPSSRGDRPKPASLRKKSRQKKSHQELLHHYKLHRRRHAA